MQRYRYLPLCWAACLLLASSGAARAAAKTLTTPTANITVTYTLPSTAGPVVNDTLVATDAGTFFFVEAATVPGWLAVTQTGTAGPTTAAAPITFQANAVAGTMQPGNYTAVVKFQSQATGNPECSITVTLSVKTAPATLTVSNTTASMAWTQGSTTYPTMTISCTSSGEPVSYTVTAGGGIKTSMIFDHSGGVAYPWGSTVTLSFQQGLFITASPGTTLTGTVTVTPNNGAAATTINVSIDVNPAAAVISSISPTELPVDATAGHTATLVVNGTGFAASATAVKIKIGSGTFTDLTSANFTVVNGTSVIVTLDAPTYTAAAQTLTIGVQNTGVGSQVTAPVYVTAAPIVYAVTNSGSFVQSSGNPQVSAYELVSIFGTNFDSANGLATNSVNSLGIYPAAMNNSHGDAVKVSFYQGTANTTKIADAPIIFVSGTQINALVPAAVASLLGTGGATTADAANIVVSVNGVTNDTNNLVPVDVAAATPGIFTPSGSGRGAAAVLNADWSLNSATAPAARGTVVHIYATGLGTPTSTGANTVTTAAIAYPASCISPAEYLKVLTGATNPPATPLGSVAGGSPLAAADASLTAIDGALLQSANFYGNRLPPCTAPGAAGVQVKLGTSATALNPTYAGFVMDSIAGLNQIDLVLPSAFTPAPPSAGGPIALYVFANGVQSQGGVTIYVK
jgi:uncharacterized protein (TIGR03437 family)